MKSIALLLFIGLAGIHAFSDAQDNADSGGCYGSTTCYSIAEIKQAKQTPRLFTGSFEGCHVRLTDSFGGNLLKRKGVDNRFNGIYAAPRPPIKGVIPDTFGFGLNCYNIDDGRVNDGWAKFNEQKKQWKLHFSGDEEERKYYGNNGAKIYQIRALNSQGYVVTNDDLIGEEWRRDRNMHFCLLHPPKALCGDAPVMRLNDPKSNVLPYVLQILRSIEFIDDAGPEKSVGAEQNK